MVQESCDACAGLTELGGVRITHSWVAEFKADNGKFVVKGVPGNSRVTVYLGGQNIIAEKSNLKSFFDAIAEQP